MTRTPNPYSHFPAYAVRRQGWDEGYIAALADMQQQKKRLDGAEKDNTKT